MSAAKLLRRLRASVSGVAVTEFALAAPFLLGFGLWGIETANLALTNMRVSQLATHIADNASRIGDTSTLENRRIYEFDINDLLYGAQLQMGSLELYRHGRVIISEVEREDTGEGVGRHYIKWQRCRGAKPVTPQYGGERDRLPGGIGPVGAEVFAEDDESLVFVEVYYTYQPLVSDMFVRNRDIAAIASFMVRDDRDPNGVHQRDRARPDPVQSCSAYKGTMSVSGDGGMSG